MKKLCKRISSQIHRGSGKRYGPSKINMNANIHMPCIARRRMKELQDG